MPRSTELDVVSPPDTYRVSELGSEISGFLGEAFVGLWVGGEVQRPHLSRRGHLYFQLVEKGHGDEVRGSLGAVLFRGDLARARRALREAGVELEDGQSLRCFVDVDFYPPAGRLQLIVREVDPLFSIGALAHRRRQVLESLAAVGLLERNSDLDLPLVPLRLGLVASKGSAGVEDFLATLRSSGWAFQVLLLDAAVQGASAEAELSRAIQRLDRVVRSERLEVDVYVLVRGGGARSDLAAFDSQKVAEAIARAERPLLTGLGHEIDESIADRVAHRAFKTPTGVAEFLCQRVGEQDGRVGDLANRLTQAGRWRIAEGVQKIERAGSALASARTVTARAGHRVDEMARLVARLSELRLESARRQAVGLGDRLVQPLTLKLELATLQCSTLAGRLADATKTRLGRSQSQLEATARLCQQLSPRPLLRRGFSITRDSRGRTVRSVDQVEQEERLTTEVVDGTIDSRVEGLQR